MLDQIIDSETDNADDNKSITNSKKNTNFKLMARNEVNKGKAPVIKSPRENKVVHKSPLPPLFKRKNIPSPKKTDDYNEVTNSNCLDTSRSLPPPQNHNKDAKSGNKNNSVHHRPVRSANHISSSHYNNSNEVSSPRRDHQIKVKVASSKPIDEKEVIKPKPPSNENHKKKTNFPRLWTKVLLIQPVCHAVNTINNRTLPTGMTRRPACLVISRNKQKCIYLIQIVFKYLLISKESRGKSSTGCSGC